MVVLLLLASSFLPMATLVPSANGQPSWHGDGSDRSSASPASDGEDRIPLYKVVQGPESSGGFATSVANLWDVQGDGIDDLLIGKGYGILLEPGQEPWPTKGYNSGNYLLPGRDDRAFATSQLSEIENTSGTWTYRSERWLGDVNGDGYADMVSAPSDPWYLLEDDEDIVPTTPPALIQVRYGTEDGLPEEADLLIDVRPKDITDLPNETWISFQYGGVGDVNGDTFNDLMVLRHRIDIWDEEERRKEDGNGRDDPDEPPWPEPIHKVIPPDFQLFLGSEDGLPAKPSWNSTLGADWERWWLSGIHHADVNGDGYSDVILSSGSAPHITIHHGSEDGLKGEPDRTITFNQQFSWGWNLHTPVDINGDKYDDIVVDYGQTEGLIRYVQYIYIYQGSSVGVATQPTKEIKLVSHEGARALLSDVNGDGLHDVVIAYPETDPRDIWPPYIILHLRVHFNSGGAFPEDPNWRHAIKDLRGYYLSSLDTGDFDGDGYGDMAYGLPIEPNIRPDGTPTGQPGNVVLVFGGGIMDLLRPITLIGGPVCYADYRAYDFRVNANPTGLVDLPERVTLTLDPGGADVELECGLPFGGSYIVEISDPNDYVNLTSTLLDIVRDPGNNTAWIHFRVVFGWNWPDEDMNDVLVESVRGVNSTIPYTAKALFRVENDLDFYGPLSAHGGWQGPLAEGDWVRAGETVTVTGPVVVYEGTTDLYPPAGTCNIVVQDNDGDFSSVAMAPGAPLNLSLVMDLETDLEENLTLNLQDLPGTASVVSNPRFHLRVDGDAPTFRNAVPEEEDWHSSSQVLVSITADDTGTSGVRASTLAYQYSTNGGLTYTDWTREGLETTSDGEAVDGLVIITLPDGSDNLVRWRAMDLVGNGNSVSDAYRIKVDTKNVTFTDECPDPNAWQTTRSIQCGVTIQDISGAGIDVTKIMYRVSFENLSHYGPWVDFDEGSMETQETVTVQVLLELGESGYNYVQWRAFDIAGNGHTTSPHYRVRVDATPIEFSDFEPTEPQATGRVHWWANVSDKAGGSGVDMTTLMYRYRTTGGEWSTWIDLQMKGEPMRTFISDTIELPDGSENVMQFRGVDVAGNGPTLSDEYVIVVDTTAPVFLAITPGPDEKQPDPTVTVTVSLTDAVIGLDTSGVEYRFGTDGEGSMGEWTALPVDAADGGSLGTVAIELARGTGNVVQFRARDLLGNTGTSEVASIWVNRVPTAVISSPKAGVEYKEGEKVLLNASASSDADGDRLNYTWYIEGQTEPLAYGKVLERTLPVGVYNLTLIVKDTDEAAPTTGVYVTVEHLPPPTSKAGSWASLLVLLIIVFLLVLGISYYLQRRRLLAQEAEDSFEEVP